MLKVAFLGAWHSHAAMHVREAAARPGEVELVGMYAPDPAVIQQNQERWAEHGLDIPVFASIEDVLNVLRTDPGALHLSVRIVLRLPRHAIPLQPIGAPGQRQLYTRTAALVGLDKRENQLGISPRQFGATARRLARIK